MKRIYPLVILLALAACKKDAPDAGLPPATQVGANTGGCLVNGQAFVAEQQGGSLLSNPFPALDGGFAFDSVYYVTLRVASIKASVPRSCSSYAPEWLEPTCSIKQRSTTHRGVHELS